MALSGFSCVCSQDLGPLGVANISARALSAGWPRGHPGFDACVSDRASVGLFPPWLSK